MSGSSSRLARPFAVVLHTCGISAVRTSIYLTEEQRGRIDSIRDASGVTLSEVIRRSLGSYLAAEFPDPASALGETFGSSPEADSDLPSTDEWTRR
jgi:hypothetical protein